MSDDERHILDSIAAIARGLGRAPSQSEFFALARISDHSVTKSFPRWSDAVRAAGLQPYTLNIRVDDSDLLRDRGEVVRRNHAVPSRRAYRHHGKYDIRTIERRFGVSWSSLPQVFRNFAQDQPEWADVLALLPALKSPAPAPRNLASGVNVAPRLSAASCLSPALLSSPAVHRSPNAFTYGNPIDFRNLRHEPVNEQGVVLLFGMLAEELGYMVETVQTGFPDCQAMRQIAPERWQRVKIEFEFESKNFRDHGHSLTDCDVIVCWQHNWADCPKDIEVLELSSIIKSLANSED